MSLQEIFVSHSSVGFRFFGFALKCQSFWKACFAKFVTQQKHLQKNVHFCTFSEKCSHIPPNICHVMQTKNPFKMFFSPSSRATAARVHNYFTEHSGILSSPWKHHCVIVAMTSIIQVTVKFIR